MNNPFLYAFLLTLLTLPGIYTAQITDVKTCADLQELTHNLQGTFQLVNDIDCSGVNFQPIGDVGNPFRGVLNGASFRILNLSIQKPTYNNIGLFSATNTSTILQLALINVNMLGQSNVGGLIGNGFNTTITDVTVTGVVQVATQNNGSYGGGLIGYSFSHRLLRVTTSVTVTGNSYLGGFIGMANNVYNGWSANITRCYASGSVTGLGSYIGGLIGSQSAYGVLLDSFATGNVQGVGYLGGFVGSISSAVTVSNCYATGNVVSVQAGSTGNYVGGFIGSCMDCRVSDCYATGKVRGAGNVGGLIGYFWTEWGNNVTKTYATGLIECLNSSTCGAILGSIFKDVVVIDSYFDFQTTNQTTSKGGGEGKTTEQMYDSKTFVNWDFERTWDINEGSSYPWLRRTTLVYSCNELYQLISGDPSLTYSLANNIDCAATPWTPIGTPDRPFTGTFNGNGYSITGLNIQKEHESDRCVGFFGYTAGAAISNMKLQNINVIGETLVGGLIAYATAGTRISNITVNGLITSNVDAQFGAIGGLVGCLSSSLLENSAVGVTINAPKAQNVGGLVGQSDGGRILNSYSLGAILGFTSVGGLIGTANLGGSITNTYSAGKVTGTLEESLVGGLLAANNNYASITSSYWDVQTSGQSSSAGGVGKSTSEMYQQATYMNWDFATLWSILNGYTYPFLKTQ